MSRFRDPAMRWGSPSRDELLTRLWGTTDMSADDIAIELNKLPGKTLDGRMTCRYAGRIGVKRSEVFFKSRQAPSRRANAAMTEYRHLIDKTVILEDEIVDAAAVRSWALRNNVKPDLKSVNEKRRSLGLPGFAVKIRGVDLRLRPCRRAA